MPLSRKYCKSIKRKTRNHKIICKKYGLIAYKNKSKRRTKKSQRRSKKYKL